jgi:hypothetical protein
MIRRWFISLWVFPVWLIAFGLAWIALFLGHELVMVFAAQTMRWGQYIGSLVHVVYYIIAGLFMMGFFILSLDYLKQSARKTMLLRGSLISLAMPLLIIALLQAGLMLYGYFPADLIGILLMAVEGLAGACMLLLAKLQKIRSRGMSNPGG